MPSQHERTPLLPSAPRARHEKLSSNARMWLALGGVWAISNVTLSSAPFPMFFVLVFALSSGFICFGKIAQELAETVPTSFLISTFFIMFFPGFLAITTADIFVTLLTIHLVIGSLESLRQGTSMQKILSTLPSFKDSDKLIDGKQPIIFRMALHLWRNQLTHQHVSSQTFDISPGKLMLVCLLCFLAMAVVEQVGTLVVARRYRYLPREVGVRDIASVACVSALGLALAKVTSFVCSLLNGLVMDGDTDAWQGIVLFGFVCTAVEFSLRLLTGLFIGVQLARCAVLSEDVATWELLAVPVLAQFAYAGVGAIAVLCLEQAPLLVLLAVVVAVAVFVVLWWYVMRAYRDTVEKEDLALVAQRAAAERAAASSSIWSSTTSSIHSALSAVLPGLRTGGEQAHR